MALTIERVPLGALTPYERNPRTISPERFEHLKRTISAHPELLEARPIIATRGCDWTEDGTVIAGNMRMRAVFDLDWAEVPVVYVTLTEAKAREWMLLDNIGFGEWEDDALAEHLHEHNSAGEDMDLTGFAGVEWVRLVDNLTASRAEPEVDEIPPVPKRPISKRGEVYELGPHRLLCGDATDDFDVGTVMNGERATLCMTSPPYIDLRDYEGGKDLTVETLAAFLPLAGSVSEIVALNLGIVIRDDTVVRYWDTYIEAAAAAGMKLLAWNVWDKGHATNIGSWTRGFFPVQHEWVFLFGRASRKLTPTVPNKGAGRIEKPAQRGRDGVVKTRGRVVVKRFRNFGSVLNLPGHKGSNEGDHPAVFPVGLPGEYLKIATKPGEIIFDPFAGSGTTLVAAHQLNRRAFLIEIDPGYCDVIRARYARLASAP